MLRLKGIEERIGETKSSYMTLLLMHNPASRVKSLFTLSLSNQYILCSYWCLAIKTLANYFSIITKTLFQYGAFSSQMCLPY